MVAGTAGGWGRARVLGSGDSAAALAAAPDRTALALSPGEAGTIPASSYDAVPDVRVVARVRGRRIARERAVRWTVDVRNAGRIPAQGMRVRLSAGEGGRLLSARPPAARAAGTTSLWRLGRMARGGRRTIVATIRPRGAPSRAHLQATVSAASMPPVWTPASVRVPSERITGPDPGGRPSP